MKPYTARTLWISWTVLGLLACAITIIRLRQLRPEPVQPHISGNVFKAEDYTDHCEGARRALLAASRAKDGGTVILEPIEYHCNGLVPGNVTLR